MYVSMEEQKTTSYESYKYSLWILYRVWDPSSKSNFWVVEIPSETQLYFHYIFGFTMQQIAEQKLKAFSIGTMGKRQMSKKELEDQRKKEQEEAAAQVRHNKYNKTAWCTIEVCTIYVLFLICDYSALHVLRLAIVRHGRPNFLS